MKNKTPSEKQQIEPADPLAKSSEELLRQLAEKHVREKARVYPANTNSMSLEEIEHTFQEVQIHRIELEMQNEELRKTQAELDKLRARYFDLYELAPVGYLIVSAKSMILEANLKATSLLGVARSNILKQPLSRFIFLEDQDIYYHFRKLLCEEQLSQECELRMLKSDGNSHWVHLAGTAVINDGELTCRLVLSDIDKRKQTEAALRASEETYHSILNASPDDITITDLTGKILMVSTMALKMTGSQAEAELIGKNIIDFIVVEDQERAKQNLILMHQGINTGVEEYQGLRVDKSTINLEVNAEFIRDASGKPNKMVFVARDITKRKMIESELKEIEERYHSIFTLSSDALFVIDKRNGTIVDVNAAACGLYGYTYEELLQLKNTDMSAEPEKTKKAMLTFDDGQGPIPLRWHKKKDGTVFPVEIAASLITLKAQPLLLVAIRDISERIKKSEEILYLSYHDQLTGLYNRRFYEEELKRLDTERNLPLTIAMGDVNGLKLVNDSFGHTLGDVLLQKVAEILKLGCRADDIIARLGGDEFVIILPKTDVVEAEQVINRINELASKEKVGNLDISISFGYNAKTKKQEDLQEVFKDAENHMYRHKLHASSSMRSKTVNLIMSTLYEKNHREMLHSQRVSELCVALAQGLQLEQDEVKQIKIAGLMHDIGKIGISEKILNSTKQLNQDEKNEIRRHPEIGYRILSSVNEFSEIATIVLQHQERWDGTGYPRGLKGMEISLSARIITIADAFDAMTRERTYGKSLDRLAAIAEIKSCAGTQFDPALAKVFIEEVLEKGLDGKTVG